MGIAKSVQESHEYYLRFSFLTLVIATAAISIQIVGGAWDDVQHVLQEVDSFFSASHTVMYGATALAVVAAGLAAKARMVAKKVKDNSLNRSFNFLILGATLQVISGTVDYYWHQILGFYDATNPFSLPINVIHLTFTTGMFLIAIGATFGLKKMLLIGSSMANIRRAMIMALGALWITGTWMFYGWIVYPFIAEDGAISIGSRVITAITVLHLVPLIGSIALIVGIRKLDLIPGLTPKVSTIE